MGDESDVIRMHSGNGEHVEMDEAAQACFEKALDDTQLSNDARLRTSLSDYFRWATETMSSCPNSAEDVAAGLTIPKWSWDGPVLIS
jgi:hemoglobin